MEKRCTILELSYIIHTLDTLAQNETNKRSRIAIIMGEGTELGNNKTLKGRAKRRTISQKIALSFVSIAEKNKRVEQLKSFWILKIVPFF